MAREQASNLSEIFWGAIAAPSDERTPEAVARHALRCIHAFEVGEVRNADSGAPLSLMELLADLGIEEDLVYASPELVRGETLDERSLVFTIGVLIFERLTDRHPFGTTEAGRLARLRRGEMGSGVNYFPSVPKQLREILMRSMGPFPEERFRGLGAMKTELAAFVGDPALAVSEPAPKFFEATTAVGRPPAAEAARPGLHEAKTEALALDETDTEPGAKGPPAKRAFHEAKTELTEPPTPSIGEADKAPEERRPRFDTTEYGPGASSARSGEIVAPPPGRQPPPPAPRAATVVEPHPPERRTRKPEAPSPEPAPRAHRPTEQVTPVTRRSGFKWAPLLYIGVGAIAASAAFLIFGPSSGPRGNAPPGAPPTPAGRATAPAPAPAAPAAADAAPAPVPKATAKEPAATTPPAPTATAPTPRATPIPKAEPVPRKVASRALQGGRQVLKAIDRCGLPQNGRSFRVSVFAQRDGKVVRAFLSPRPWLTRKAISCARGALPGVQLGLTLARPDFVEWSFRVHPDGRYEVKLVRPKVLLD